MNVLRHQEPCCVGFEDSDDSDDCWTDQLMIWTAIGRAQSPEPGASKHYKWAIGARDSGRLPPGRRESEGERAKSTRIFLAVTGFCVGSFGRILQKSGKKWKKKQRQFLELKENLFQKNWKKRILILIITSFKDFFMIKKNCWFFFSNFWFQLFGKFFDKLKKKISFNFQFLEKFFEWKFCNWKMFQN